MRYREVLRTPWWTYAVIAGLLALLSFTFAAVVTVPYAIVVFVILAAIAAPLVWRRQTQIYVDQAHLRVAGQELDLAQIAQVTPLDEAGFRLAAGPQADSRAMLILRNLACKTGVKIDLKSGTTPYWLVSSKHPEQLAQALAPV